MRINSDIDVVHNISKEDFNKYYLSTQKPVVIKGLIENKPAGSLWSFDYFKKTMGDLEVDIYDNGLKKDGSAFTSADMKMRFEDFLNVIDKDEHTGLRMFLFNLFKHNPELKKEFPCPDIFKGMLDHVGFTFFAGKDTTVRIHYDIDMSNVLHTQVLGRKRVVLIAPEYNELVYRLPLNTYSLVDLDNPDYNRYPGLRYVIASECILEPGDSIFIPSGYWHLMTYLDGGCSVAYRKIAQTNKMIVHALLNLIVYLPVDKLLVNLFPKGWQALKERIADKRAGEILMNSKKYPLHI